MALLEDLQKYCKGKTIIIVGNSSGLLANDNRKLIDTYDIVVRINRGYQNGRQLYNEHVGSKTNILSIGVKTANQANVIIGNNSVSYILSPIIHSDSLDYQNVYHVKKDTYDVLKHALGDVKPSTGISTYNFFNRFVNFTRLDLIGFDFFSTSTRHRNQLGHIKVHDHDGKSESAFFMSTHDPDKTIIHKPKNTMNLPNNIPKYSIARPFIFKNNKQR
jgi:hypothetical protein